MGSTTHRTSVKIEHRRDNFNYFEPEQWPAIQQFLADSMARLEAALRKPLEAAYKSLANTNPETALADETAEEPITLSE